MKTKILITGSTGLVGSRIIELLDQVYDFDQISSSMGTNILNKQELREKVKLTNPDLVLHLAAKTHVDGCELDKEKDQNAIDSTNFKENIQEKTAWAVNVIGTENIITACKEFNKKVIFISTDFVFNGAKKSYKEEDEQSPINWYAKTKFEGEKLVQNSGLPFLILRIAYPFRADFQKNDFVRTVLNKLINKEPLNMVTDHIMVPTFIDDIAYAIDVLIQKNEVGMFHAVGSQSITPYNAAFKIAEVFNLDPSLINKTTRREYFAKKAQRPFCLNLKNDKISKLGIELLGFEQALVQIKKQREIINKI